MLTFIIYTAKWLWNFLWCVDSCIWIFIIDDRCPNFVLIWHALGIATIVDAKLKCVLSVRRCGIEFAAVIGDTGGINRINSPFSYIIDSVIIHTSFVDFYNKLPIITVMGKQCTTCLRIYLKLTSAFSAYFWGLLIIVWPYSTDRLSFGLTRVSFLSGPERLRSPDWLTLQWFGYRFKLTCCKNKSKIFHLPSLIFWNMKSPLTLSVFVINENHCNYKRSILWFIRHLWNQKDHLSSNYPCDQNCRFDNLKRHSYNLRIRD